MECLEEIMAGTVIEYDEKAHEAVVKLSHELCVGNEIRIKGKSQWEQILERMFIDGKPVAKAFPGDIARIGFQHQAGKNDSVFLLMRVVVSPTGPSKVPGEPLREYPVKKKTPLDELSIEESEVEEYSEEESQTEESTPGEQSNGPVTDSPHFDMPDLPDPENYPDSQGGKGSHYKPKGHGSGG